MLKEECIIHIGMHKTGTTSIQKTFFKYLENETISYVNLKVPNHTLPIYSMFHTIEEPHYIHKRKGLSNREIREYNTHIKKILEDDFLNNPAQKMLISGEGISLLSHEDLVKLKNFLKYFFKKITIVAYIRPPKSYIESIFQQHLKGGMSDFKLSYPKYQKRFEKFDLVFGKENVLLWKFNPVTFVKGNVVLDFCSKLDISINEKHIVKTNESLSKEAIKILFLYRKYGPEYGIGSTVIIENQKLIKFLQKIKGEKFRFSSSLIKPIFEKNIKDIHWMEERLGESLQEKMVESINSINSEKDLLTIDTEVIEKLKKIVSKDFSSSDNIQKDIIDTIHSFRY